MSPYIYRVREIVRTVDGDTVDCVISLGFGLDAAFRFRVAHIDAYEVYGVHASQRGQQAAEFTRQWLAARNDLLVRTFKGSTETVGIGDGAFGRWLGEFIGPDGESLGQALLEQGHAVRSEG